MSTSLPDLSLVPTSDLVDAACRRFDHAVFHGIIARNAPTPDSDGTQIFVMRRIGDPLTCVGMATVIERCILNDIAGNTEETDSSHL